MPRELGGRQFVPMENPRRIKASGKMRTVDTGDESPVWRRTDQYHQTRRAVQRASHELWALAKISPSSLGGDFNEIESHLESALDILRGLEAWMS